MNSIVEYDSAKLTKNNYPKRIISPSKLDLCCLSHTGAGMDSRIAMDTIVVTDIPRAFTLMAGYPTVIPGATMLIPGGITDTLITIPALSGTTATEERKRQSERARA